MAEMPILRRIMLACSRGAARLFRVNTGTGWVGEVVNRWTQVEDGRTVRYITIRQPRPLRAGLVTGGADTMGWRSVVITPDMVGRRVAVFTAIEVKDNGRLTADQRTFLTNVHQAGGIAGVARSADQAIALLDSWPADEVRLR
jgi:hypothetical protein